MRKLKNISNYIILRPEYTRKTLGIKFDDTVGNSGRDYQINCNIKEKKRVVSNFIYIVPIERSIQTFLW